jgi:hypothetical protein
MATQPGQVAPVSTGATTAPAAPATSTQGPPPQTAAPTTVPTPNLANNTAPAKGKNYAAKKPVGSNGPVISSHGLSQILAAFSDHTMSQVKHTAHTFVVPSSIFFYQVLALMDQQMIRTKRFTDANSDWHPFVSHLYFGIMFFYWTLKCESTATSLSQDHLDFIEFLERNFNAQNMLIPGPLVPFFQSLAANAGPYSNYGNLIFAIPNNLGVTQANHFRYINRHDQLLPNIIFVLDQFIRLLANISPNAAPGPNVSLETVDTLFTHIYGTGAAANADNNIVMLSPNGRAAINQTTGLLTGLQSNADYWLDILPSNALRTSSIYTTGNDATFLAFDQILGFRGVAGNANTNYNWFENVQRIMQPYATFFLDSASLGSVSTIGTGIGYMITDFLDSQHNADTFSGTVQVRDIRHRAGGTSRYINPSYDRILASFYHTEETLDLIAIQMGMYTQLNLDLTDLNAIAGIVNPGPTRDNVSIGPISNRQTTYTAPTIDARAAIAPFISGYYHVPTANKLGN